MKKKENEENISEVPKEEFVIKAKEIDEKKEDITNDAKFDVRDIIIIGNQSSFIK